MFVELRKENDYTVVKFRTIFKPPYFNKGIKNRKSLFLLQHTLPVRVSESPSTKQSLASVKLSVVCVCVCVCASMCRFWNFHHSSELEFESPSLGKSNTSADTHVILRAPWGMSPKPDSHTTCTFVLNTYFVPGVGLHPGERKRPTSCLQGTSAILS